MSEFSIPVIDLSDFECGDQAARSSLVNALGQAYREVGFVAVKNHGVPEELIERFYLLVRKFFSLPAEQKSQYEIPGLAGQRGFTSFGREHAKGSDAPDLKEFWQFGQTDLIPGHRPDDYPPNVEVAELPDFNRTGEELFRAFEKSGSILLRAIALHLDLPENYFDAYIKGGNSILRAIYYPPITSEPKSAIRAEQHEDINLITLLVGASADGLELLNRENQWIPVSAPEGCLVVNVGDMLQRHTNNRLRSTTHRVVNPPRERWHTERFSIPFFLHPVSEMKLDCLKSCIDADNPSAYAPITAGEYLDERLREIGLKK
jgi:isopenicillin N synthase-like dioxygenase